MLELIIGSIIGAVAMYFYLKNEPKPADATVTATVATTAVPEANTAK